MTERRDRGPARRGRGVRRPRSVDAGRQIREIPQRELRNDVSRVLREVSRGARFRVTVSGRPIADLVPAVTRQTWVPREVLFQILRDAPLDPGFFRDIDAAVDDAADWP